MISIVMRFLVIAYSPSFFHIGIYLLYIEAHHLSCKASQHKATSTPCKCPTNLQNNVVWRLMTTISKTFTPAFLSDGRNINCNCRRKFIFPAVKFVKKEDPHPGGFGRTKEQKRQSAKECTRGFFSFRFVFFTIRKSRSFFYCSFLFNSYPTLWPSNFGKSEINSPTFTVFTSFFPILNLSSEFDRGFFFFAGECFTLFCIACWKYISRSLFHSGVICIAPCSTFILPPERKCPLPANPILNGPRRPPSICRTSWLLPKPR